MQIYGPFRVSTTNAASNVQATQRVDASQVDSVDNQDTSARSVADRGVVDQLDLSQSATAANRLDASASVAGDGIRFDRVAEIRRQIADGSYDSPEKMDAALDRFLDLLG